MHCFGRDIGMEATMATNPGGDSLCYRERIQASPRPLVMTLVAVVFTMSANCAGAQNWQFQPYLELIATYTDNLYLLPEGAEVDSYIGQLNPGFSVAKEQGRFRTNTEYRLQSVFFSEDSDFNTIYHQLNSTSTLTLAAENLFVDFDASIDQTVVDPQQSIPISNVVATANLGDVTYANINPYLIEQLGTSQSYLRLDYVRGIGRYDGFGLSTFSRVDDFTQDRAGLYLGTEQQDTGIEWSATYDYQFIDYETVPDYKFERAQLGVGIPITRGFRLLASGGAESDLLISLQEGGLDSDFWEVGFRINAGPNKSLELRTGERFFGSSYFGSFEYEGRRLNAFVIYSEDPTTSALGGMGGVQIPFSIAGVGDSPDQSVPVDDVLIAPIRSEVYVSKTLRARIGFTGGRSTAFLAYFDENREFLDETTVLEGSQDGQSAITAGVVYALGPRTDLEISAARLQYDYADTVTDTNVLQITAGAVRRFGRGLDVRLSYRHAIQETNAVSNFNNYTENAIDITLVKQF